MTASATNFSLFITWITSTLVTTRRTLMILAIQRFAAHIFARGTVAAATFLVARMFATVANFLALYVTAELFGALDIFGLGATSAGFLHHLNA